MNSKVRVHGVSNFALDYAEGVASNSPGLPSAATLGKDERDTYAEGVVSRRTDDWMVCTNEQGPNPGHAASIKLSLRNDSSLSA